MGYDPEYGVVITEHGDIPPDEPVVLFRARDIHLPALLLAYRKLCEAGGSPERHLRMADRARGLAQAWQRMNRSLVRAPDSESSRAWLGDEVV
jgi:hypothetical protein